MVMVLDGTYQCAAIFIEQNALFQVLSVPARHREGAVRPGSGVGRTGTVSYLTAVPFILV